MKSSWQTTTAGILSALGGSLVGAHLGPDMQWLGTIGQVLLAGGTLWMGAAARDNKVSSEDAGAK